MSDLPDEETVRSRRRAGRDAMPDSALDETVRAEPARRRTTFEPPASGDGNPGETAMRGGTGAEGSTIIARRESRRRAMRTRSEPDSPRPTPTPPPGPVAPRTAGRLASAPDPAAPDAYAARSAAPIRAERAAPPARAPQTVVDGAAATTAHHRRSRRTALIVIFASGAVAFAAAASLVAIALHP